jgi:hypothetical protein
MEKLLGEGLHNLNYSVAVIKGKNEGRRDGRSTWHVSGRKINMSRLSVGKKLKNK